MPKEFEHTIAEGNLVKLAEADVAFHEVIYQASDNKRLIQVLNNMREQIYRLSCRISERKVKHEMFW